MVLLICNIHYAGAVQAALATIKQRHASENVQFIVLQTVQFKSPL